MSELGITSLKSITGSGLVCGKLHQVIITEFLDKYFIIVSHNGKVGTLVQILFETNAMKTSTSLATKVLLGKDEPEVHGVALNIVEELKIKKPVIFGFSANEYNSSTALGMRQLIAKTLQIDGKENLSDCNNIP